MICIIKLKLITAGVWKWGGGGRLGESNGDSRDQVTAARRSVRSDLRGVPTVAAT